MITLRIFDDYVYLFRDGVGTRSSAEEFLEPIEREGSLKALKEVFPARRAALLKALTRFGFDFDDLLKKDFQQDYSNVQIASKHGVDAKWIQVQRKRLKFPAYMGRPSKHPTDAELVEAFQLARGNYSEAARKLGINRATFTERYNEVRDRVRR